jgi:hypothetical protein
MTMKRESGNLGNKGKLLLLISLTLIIAVVISVAFYGYQGAKSSGNSYDFPQKTIRDFQLVSNKALQENEKLVILFIGAEACPYCAAESWSIVYSLSSFGSWSGLTDIISNSTDKIPNVPGYGFASSSLRSSNISFWEDELTTSSWNQTLQTLNASDASLFKRYDPQGAIPFLLVGGMYLHIGSGVSPSLISGMDWSQCYREAESKDQFSGEVNAEANNISSVISYLLDNRQYWNEDAIIIALNLSFDI